MISADDIQPPPCQFFNIQQDCEDNQCCWYESPTNFSESSCNECTQNTFNTHDSLIVSLWAAAILIFSVITVFVLIHIVICVHNIRFRRRIQLQRRLFYLQLGLYPRIERVFALAIVQRVESSPEITQELPVAQHIPERTVPCDTFAVREIDV